MKFLRRLRALFRREKLDAEMAEEMRLHMELQTERNIAAGMSVDEARYAALREFGNIAGMQERARDERGWVWLEQRGREFRFAVRSLRRAPLFSLTVIATFALCLGPNTAILSTLYSLVLKPQPFSEPEQIVRIYNAFDKLSGTRSRQDSSIPQYRDFKANADLFTEFAVMRYAGTTIGEETVPERVFGMRVNAGFFDFFGVQPVLGRFGTAEEDVAGRDRVLVLAQHFWESRFQADPGVIGRIVRLGGEPWTIIGVAPRSLEVLDIHTQFFKPFESLANEEDTQTRYTGRVTLFGRLKPGVTEAMALAQLNVLERRFVEGQATPIQRQLVQLGGQRFAFERVGEKVRSAVKAPLSLLQAGAVLVLLMGGVNVLNLMLARANSRRSELATRLALGASRGALLRQLLAESLLLTLIAISGGAALAWMALKVINHYLGTMMSLTASPLTLEPAVLGSMGLVALVLGAVVGGVPLVFLTRAGLSLAETRTASAGPGMRWFSSSLVVVQVATALVLLIGAGLLVRSFAQVISVDPGYDARHIVQGRMAIPGDYADAQKNVALQQRLLAAFREIPGVERAALVPDIAIGAGFRSLPFTIRDAADVPAESQPLILLNLVSPDFFPTMNVRLLEGRFFTDADDWSSSPVVIVDDLFVRRHFPDGSAVGREINVGGGRPSEGRAWPRIVGVVKRAELAGLEARHGLPFVYLPAMQQPSGGFTFIVRSPRPSADVLAAMRLKLREIDPRIPFYAAASLQDGLEDMLRHRRVLMVLIAVFAGLALLLAGVGLYGLLAYDVTQRTREIGIRGAIGATRRQIVAMILSQGMAKTALGTATGGAGALYLTRFIRDQLFDIQAFDPVTYVGVAVIIVTVALLACWLPARRAAKVDPVIALRAE